MSSGFFCSRRKFCVAAGAGLVGLGLPGCDVGDSRLGIGAIDPAAGGPGAVGTGPTPHDMAMQQQGGNPDLAQQQGGNPDLAMKQGGGCTGSIMAGAASAIGVNQSKRFTDNVSYDLYLCRDSGGLFTVDASCTHAGRLIKQQGQGWYCPAHGATFAFDGTNPTAPAFSPLANYAVCVDSGGNVTIDPNTTVSATTRV
jgi:nitrite reductase/ring-hydroxylating ferredoxin subunit